MAIKLATMKVDDTTANAAELGFDVALAVVAPGTVVPPVVEPGT